MSSASLKECALYDYFLVCQTAKCGHYFIKVVYNESGNLAWGQRWTCTGKWMACGRLAEFRAQKKQEKKQAFGVKPVMSRAATAIKEGGSLGTATCWVSAGTGEGLWEEFSLIATYETVDIFWLTLMCSHCRCLKTYFPHYCPDFLLNVTVPLPTALLGRTEIGSCELSPDEIFTSPKCWWHTP